MMNSAIQVRGLKKSYDSNIVLNGLDFQIEKGHPVSEKPIDDFQTGTKDTHRNAKSIFRAPKEKIKR